MKKTTRRSTKILLIRHAEKPAKDAPPFGVTLKGDRSKESLEVRGWQRAGALTHLLAPPDGHFQHAELAKPQFLYASKPVKRRGSRRPVETITPLAEKLGIEINSEYRRSEVEEHVRRGILAQRRGPYLLATRVHSGNRVIHPRRSKIRTRMAGGSFRYVLGIRSRALVGQV